MAQTVAKKEYEKHNKKLFDKIYKDDNDPNKAKGDAGDYYYKREYGINVQHNVERETVAKYQTYGEQRAEETEK